MHATLHSRRVAPNKVIKVNDRVAFRAPKLRVNDVLCQPRDHLRADVDAPGDALSWKFCGRDQPTIIMSIG